MSHSRRTSGSPSRSYSHSPLSYRTPRSCSRSSDLVDVENPGNILFVAGLRTQTTEEKLEKHFSTEGKVIDVQLVYDPRTRSSRGFGFLTMASVRDADNCIKYLDRSVLDDRAITVERSKRCRRRKPTPGKYLGPERGRDHILVTTGGDPTPAPHSHMIDAIPTLLAIGAVIPSQRHHTIPTIGADIPAHLLHTIGTVGRALL